MRSVPVETATKSARESAPSPPAGHARSHATVQRPLPRLLALALATAAFAAAPGCTTKLRCYEHEHCGPNMVCTPDERCIPNVCGDGIVLGEEVCDDGNAVSGDGCSADCRSDETCGNGRVDRDIGEACDDGNTVGGDGCSADCRSNETCGNGVLDAALGEVCDDGNAVSGDGCSADCRSNETCGNGVLDLAAGEACDDGNTAGGDGCSAICALESCGNGALDPGEVCDDGNNLSGDGCNATCTSNETCGNGFVDSARGETCDDGNTVSGDGCSADCHLEACGNAVADPGEACDGPDLRGATCLSLGYASGSLACSGTCQFDTSACEPCGNGTVEPAAGEQCDGQNLGGHTCVTEGFGSGTLACTPGCTLDTSGCDPCGNGLREPAEGEQCDGADLGGQTCASIGLGFDGGTLACASDCALDTSGCATCGNGVREPGEPCDDGNSTDWDGCNQCVISEFQVNTTTSNNQSQSAISVNRLGGQFAVAWTHCGLLASSCEIRAQMFAQSGQTAFSEITVVGQTAAGSFQPDVAYRVQGSFVVAYRRSFFLVPSGSTDTIYLQRYDSAGQAAGSAVAVTSTDGLRQHPRVAIADNGTTTVVWQVANQDGSGFGIYGRRFNDLGQALGGEFPLNTYTSGDQTLPAIAMAGDGRFVVAWQSDGEDGSGFGIYARRYNASGVAQGAPFRVNVTTSGDQGAPTVAMASDGRFVVAWEGYGQIDGTSEIVARRFDASGVALGGELVLNSDTAGNQRNPAISMADDGAFIATWAQEGATPTTFSEIRGRRFDAGASPLGSDFTLHLYSTVAFSQGGVAVAADGRAAAVWSSDGQDGSGFGAYAQRIDSAGALLGRNP